MASTRWSEKDLLNFSKKTTRLQPNSAKEVILPLANDSSKKVNATITRRNDVIESIKHAKVTGSFKKGEYLEIMLDGAKLLSVNSLYTLNPFQRTSYKKAWHEAINWAVIQITGGPRNFSTFDHFTIEAQIQTKRRCDTDAPEGQLKFAIDGLTHAKVIIDDSPMHFKEFNCRAQKVGSPYLYLKIVNLEAHDAISN